MMKTLDWLLNAPEPWTHYRTLTTLWGRPAADAEVCAARREMLQHPDIHSLVDCAATWGERPFKRHNDASYPMYALSTLADFGLRADDPGMDAIFAKVFAYQSPEGAFQSLVNIPKAFGGDDTDRWTWIICDAPMLLYSLLAFGLAGDARVQQALTHLVSLVDENGWRCVCAPELGKFRGPGKKADACPIANLFALKALAQVPELLDSQAAHAGTEMLLGHWADVAHPKPYLFGAGSDYRKLKYPFVWYDILHVADTLSRFPFVHGDPRFQQMVATITACSDEQGRYTATSMYKAWKASPTGGWSFADKKNPSPWLTFVVLRIQKCMKKS